MMTADTDDALAHSDIFLLLFLALLLKHTLTLAEVDWVELAHRREIL